MAENLGLGIDLVFDEEKINQNLSALIGRLQKGSTSSLVMNIDTSQLAQAMNNIENLNKMKLTFDENGTALNEVQTYNTALGETVTVQRDLVKNTQNVSLNIDGLAKQKEIYTSIKSKQDEMKANESTMLKLDGERYQELRNKNDKLKEAIELEKTQLTDVKLMTQVR